MLTVFGLGNATETIQLTLMISLPIVGILFEVYEETALPSSMRLQGDMLANHAH